MCSVLVRTRTVTDRPVQPLPPDMRARLICDQLHVTNSEHPQMTEELALAWQHLSDLIIQDFIYDAFWSEMSPDTQFPKQVRQLLNDVFAILVHRSRCLSLHSSSCSVIDSLTVRLASPTPRRVRTW
jgi:hypothetical protein